MALCLVTSRCYNETVGRIMLGFGIETTFDLSYTVLQGNSSISENKVTYLLLELCPKLVDFKNFATARRSY